MFGQHQAHRDRKRLEKSQQKLKQEKKDWKAESPERQQALSEQRKNQINEKVSNSEAIRTGAREKGRGEAKNFFNEEVQGLDPEHKKALQYEANKGIKRSYQNANRKLLGEHSQHGIQGQGGVGYAQQMGLQSMARENQGQATRDINKLDRETALKKQAQIFAGGEGEASQALLDYQLAEDELNLIEERKHQKKIEEELSRLFYKV